MDIVTKIEETEKGHDYRWCCSFEDMVADMSERWEKDHPGYSQEEYAKAISKIITTAGQYATELEEDD